MRKLKLSDDGIRHVGNRRYLKYFIFIAPEARRLSRYPTRAVRVARNMIGRHVRPGRSRIKISIKDTPCYESWGKADLVEAT